MHLHFTERMAPPTVTKDRLARASATAMLLSTQEFAAGAPIVTDVEWGGAADAAVVITYQGNWGPVSWTWTPPKRI